MCSRDSNHGSVFFGGLARYPWFSSLAGGLGLRRTRHAVVRTMRSPGKCSPLRTTVLSWSLCSSRSASFLLVSLCRQCSGCFFDASSWADGRDGNMFCSGVFEQEACGSSSVATVQGRWSPDSSGRPMFHLHSMMEFHAAFEVHRDSA